MNLTCIIPFKLDSEDRLYNIKTIIKFLNGYSNKPKILIVEQGNHLPKIDGEYEHLPINFDADYFHKSKLINFGIKNIDTEYFAIYDSDVLVTEKQFISSFEMLENGKYYYSKPFKFELVNIPKSNHSSIPTLREKLLENNKINLDYLNNNLTLIERESLVSPTPAGGILMAYKQHMLDNVGLMSEYFKGYGPEDAEIIFRIKSNLFEIYEEPGLLFHLDHSRTKDSCCPGLASKYNSTVNPYYQNNINYFNMIKLFDKEKLAHYLKFMRELK
jgi:hypothetical protein